MSHVVRLEDCGPDCVAEVGGKAAGLGQLLSHGFQVPSGFAVTTAAYREFVVANGIDAEIRRALATARDVVREQDASAWIRALFEEAKAAAPLAAEITSAYDRLCGGGLAPVAVRSSAVAEDTAQASFAGQQETSLWIRSGADVVRSVKRCWGSLFTPQAITYRLRFNVAPEDVVMGVVVQAMVPAEVAGVMFTIDPVTGDRSQITIEASYGLGLAVVEGAVTPDRFDVDKVTMEIRSRFPKRKQVAYRFDERAGEVRLAEVPADEQDRPCLSDQEVMEIAALGKRIERTLGAAQDIEWALGPSGPGPRELFLLQTRPETVWSKNRREPIGPPGTTAIERVLASMMTRKADVEKGDQELT